MGGDGMLEELKQELGVITDKLDELRRHL